MILVKKASWSASRFFGILLFYIATTSLVGWYTKSTVGFFDVYSLFAMWIGPSSSFLALVVLFFTSLYLVLRISYREVLSQVRRSIPSVR